MSGRIWDAAKTARLIELCQSIRGNSYRAAEFGRELGVSPDAVKRKITRLRIKRVIADARPPTGQRAARP